MKKALLLVWLSLSASLLYAQIKLDSIIIVGLNKYVYAYNAEGKAVESIYYKWNAIESTWAPDDRTTWMETTNEHTTVYYDWNTTLEDWVPLQRDINTQTANETFYTRYSWDTENQEWEFLTQNFTIYDSNGELYQSGSYQWNPLSGAWQGLYRLTVTGTDIGVLEENWNTATNDWQWSRKTTTLVNGNDQVIELTSSIWINTMWMPSFSYNLAYDASGNLVESINFENWNQAAMDWGAKSRKTMAYDTLGNIVFRAFYFEDNEGEWYGTTASGFIYNPDTTLAGEDSYVFDLDESEWVFQHPETRHGYTYTPEGKLSEKTKSRWNTNNLTYHSRQTYSYDVAGHVIDQADWNWNAFFENWYGVSREVYDYDLTVNPDVLIYPANAFNANLLKTGKLTSQKVYSLNGQFNDWQLDSEMYYYFSEFITASKAAPAVEALKLFPNPVSNLLTLSANAPRASSYQITDLNGRILQHEKTWNGEGIDVSGLIPGSYVIRLIEGNRVITGKFIKS